MIHPTLKSTKADFKSAIGRSFTGTPKKRSQRTNQNLKARACRHIVSSMPIMLLGDTETRRSQTGILLFCNKAPTMWFSKRQNSVEASTFGSEFTAMKNAVEMIEALRYKLRMFGVPIEGPTNVFCDKKQSVRIRCVPNQH